MFNSTDITDLSKQLCNKKYAKKNLPLQKFKS